MTTMAWVLEFRSKELRVNVRRRDLVYLWVLGNEIIKSTHTNRAAPVLSSTQLTGYHTSAYFDNESALIGSFHPHSGHPGRDSRSGSCTKDQLSVSHRGRVHAYAHEDPRLWLHLFGMGKDARRPLQARPNYACTRPARQRRWVEGL